MWQDINHRMLYNNCTSDNPKDYMTAGYHPSFSPCVTAVPADWKKTTQLYYQYGTDPFVGGVSLGNRFGVFVQPFDARTNPAYRSTPACGLSFRKTYFTFDRRVWPWVGTSVPAKTGKPSPASSRKNLWPERPV